METSSTDRKKRPGKQVNKSNQLACWTWGGWEPEGHYTRMGFSNTLYFGNGDWVKEWRARADSRECLERVKDLGVTFLMTRFYKGFGMRHEQPWWDAVRAYTETCHDLGLEVWGYVQGQSLYYETMEQEIPDLENWAARTQTGEISTWGGAYYRWAPCLTNQEYLEYYKRIVTIGLNEVGLDGIHLDNSYYRHCWCKRCVQKFREWLNLREDLEECLGICSGDTVRPPQIPGAAPAYPDPLIKLWIEFGVEMRMRFLSRLKASVEACGEDKILSGNPAYPKRFSSRLLLALDPAQEKNGTHMLCVENGNLPRIENGKWYSHAEAYLLCEASGFNAFSTSWRRGEQGHESAITKGKLLTGLAEEFSYTSAVMGNNWLLRASGDGDRMLIDEYPETVEEFKKAMAFFNKISRLPELHDRELDVEVLVYLQPESISLHPGHDGQASQYIMRYLLSHKVPFKILYALSEAKQHSCKHLIVPHMSRMSDEDWQHLKEAGQTAGKHIWMFGDSGQYNEWGRTRGKSRYAQLKSSPGLHWIPFQKSWVSAGGEVRHFELQDIFCKPEGIEAIDQMLEDPAFCLSCKIDGPEYIGVNSEQNITGGKIIHLRDQSGESKKVSAVVVTVQSSGTSAKWLSYPQTEFVELSGEIMGDKIIYFLPEFYAYGLLVL